MGEIPGAAAEENGCRLRAGSEFDRQATIPKSESTAVGEKSIPGELLWRPESGGQDERAVDQFLNDIRKRFPVSMEIDEEATLTLLQWCNHDNSSALKLADVPKWPKPSAPVRATKRHRILNLQEEEHCLVCKTGGTVLVCDVAGCSRLYHPACVGLGNVPSGKWKCPRHQCAFCPDKNPPLQCDSCWISYCPEHAPFGRDTVNFQCINCTSRYDDVRRMFLEEIEACRISMDAEGKCKLLVQGRPVDLWALYHSVATLGGFNNITPGQWLLIYRHLGFRVSIRGASITDLAEIYLRQLLPYADSRRPSNTT